MSNHLKSGIKLSTTTKMLLSFLIIFSSFVPWHFLDAADNAYKKRGSGPSERMEGLKETQSSSKDFQLLSFTAFQNVKQHKDLALRFFVNSDKPIFITVRELHLVHGYFMKPKQDKWSLGWQTFSWPTKEVIDEIGIDPNQLGIVARVNNDQDGSGEIVPVIFHDGNYPPEISSYRLLFVSRETLTFLHYTLTSGTSNKPFYKNEVRREFTAGIPIPLTIDLQKVPKGIIKLSVAAKIKNLNEGPRRTYIFYHQRDALGSK